MAYLAAMHAATEAERSESVNGAVHAVFRHRRDRDEGNVPPFSPEGLTVQVLQAGPLPAVVVVGRVTIDSSPRLRSVLHEVIGERAGGGVVIDLSAVPYLDSSGVATLLEASRIARDHGVSLRLVGLSGELRLTSLAAASQSVVDHLVASMENEIATGPPPSTQPR